MPVHTLGSAGYAASIHVLITSWLSSRYGQPTARLRAAMRAVLPALDQEIYPFDPEKHPTVGFDDARDLLLAAEVLIVEADRLAAPGLGADGELTSRFVELRAYLDRQIAAKTPTLPKGPDV